MSSQIAWGNRREPGAQLRNGSTARTLRGGRTRAVFATVVFVTLLAPLVGASVVSAQTSGADLAAPVPRPPSGSTAPPDSAPDEGASAPAASDPSDASNGSAAGASEDADAADASEGGDAGSDTGEGSDANGSDAADTNGTDQPAAFEGAGPIVLVIDAAAYGIDPVVGQHVTRRMRLTAEEMGYGVVGAEETVAAAQRVRMPYPPSPADLWRVTYVARARRGAFARVWAHEGRYVFELSVASLDGSGPFFARGTSGAEDLHEVVAQLTRDALPAVEQWDAEGYTRYALAPTATPAPTTPPAPTAGVVPAPGSRVVIERRRRDNRPGRRFDLALQTEVGIGVDDRFANVLVGGRVGVRITNTIAVGVQLAYANLRGRGQRASNVLPMLMVENRIRISRRSDITVPLRFAIGYLPFNGPVVRFSAGLNVPLSSRVELQADILAPTFWILPDERTAVSLNPALELIVRL